ncbi:ATP-binding protein [Streptomyces sp. M19]
MAKGLALHVEDHGLGMAPEQYERLNHLLANPPEPDMDALGKDPRLGLFVVAKLAERHGLKVSLRESDYGGTLAVVLVPSALLEEHESTLPDELKAAAALSGSTSGKGIDTGAIETVEPVAATGGWPVPEPVAPPARPVRPVRPARSRRPPCPPYSARRPCSPPPRHGSAARHPPRVPRLRRRGAVAGLIGRPDRWRPASVAVDTPGAARPVRRTRRPTRRTRGAGPAAAAGRPAGPPHEDPGASLAKQLREEAEPARTGQEEEDTDGFSPAGQLPT